MAVSTTLSYLLEYPSAPEYFDAGHSVHKTATSYRKDIDQLTSIVHHVFHNAPPEPELRRVKSEDSRTWRTTSISINKQC